jgi:hypothetical protein
MSLRHFANKIKKNAWQKLFFLLLVSDKLSYSMTVIIDACRQAIKSYILIYVFFYFLQLISWEKIQISS